MRIAIAGKGGTGKTTIAGTLARALARQGRHVLAVDADSNPNLSAMLGVSAEDAAPLAALPPDIIVRRTNEAGSVETTFVGDVDQVIADLALDGPDGVRLLIMGKVNHGGKGCMCRAHATVRLLVGELVTQKQNGRDVIVDMEAGLEHLSRATGRHVGLFLATIEPYYRSMETARRVAELANELGVSRVYAVANKIRDDEDREAIAQFCAAHGLELLANIPYDDTLIRAERAGRTPIDFAADAPAVRAIGALAEVLVKHG